MTDKKKNLPIHSSAAEYLTFVAATGESSTSYEMRYEDENIWLTQKMMASLYDVTVAAINQHLKRIFEDGELQEPAVIKKYLITAADGKQYNTKHYNLQAIIAVGFKVNNQRAVQFRKWAGQIVKDYTIQGWTMDSERLKKGICLRMSISSASCSKFGKSVCQSASSTKRLRTCMPLRSTTTKTQNNAAVLPDRTEQDALCRASPHGS